MERTRIAGVGRACGSPAARARPGGFWRGSRLPFYPPVVAQVRFNDIAGNAQAGLGVGSNMTTPVDASCNWWGAASGPSGAGTGTGDAIVVELGAAIPGFVPFATAPIAASPATGC